MWNWLTGHDEENYQAGLEADRRNDAINDAYRAQGRLTESDYAITQERYTAALEYDPEREIETAFDDEFQSRTDSFGRAVAKPFEWGGTIVGSILKALPWWLWIVGLLAAAVYFRPLWAPLLKRR